MTAQRLCLLPLRLTRRTPLQWNKGRNSPWPEIRRETTSTLSLTVVILLIASIYLVELEEGNKQIQNGRHRRTPPVQSTFVCCLASHFFGRMLAVGKIDICEAQTKEKTERPAWLAKHSQTLKCTGSHKKRQRQMYKSSKNWFGFSSQEVSHWMDPIRAKALNRKGQ